MVNTLMQESVEDIQKVHANLVFIEPDCLLDEALDGTRDSLKSWNRS
jgi:hypothetical protein